MGSLICLLDISTTCGICNFNFITEHNRCNPIKASKSSQSNMKVPHLFVYCKKVVLPVQKTSSKYIHLWNTCSKCIPPNIKVLKLTENVFLYRLTYHTCNITMVVHCFRFGGVFWGFNCVYMLVFVCVYVYEWVSIQEGRKEMFYLMTHSSHFIYGIGHMVKDHLDTLSD